MRFTIRKDTLVRYKGNDKALFIPSRVRRIAGSVFEHCENLQAVTLPSHLEEIGEYAFFDCSDLREVIFEKGKQPQPLVIGDRAFSNCMNLQSMTLPEAVASIGSFSFGDCHALKRLAPASQEGEGILLPEGLHSIGSYAFSDCWSILSVHIPSTISFLGKMVLTGCIALEELSVQLPDESIYRFPVRFNSSHPRSTTDELLDILIKKDFNSVENYLNSYCLAADMILAGFNRQHAAEALFPKLTRLFDKQKGAMEQIAGTGLLAGILRCEEAASLLTFQEANNLIRLLTDNKSARDKMQDSGEMALLLGSEALGGLVNEEKMETLLIHLMHAENDAEIYPNAAFNKLFRALFTGKAVDWEARNRNAGKFAELLEQSGLLCQLSEACLERLALLANKTREHELQLTYMRALHAHGGNSKLDIFNRFDL